MENNGIIPDWAALDGANTQQDEESAGNSAAVAAGTDNSAPPPDPGQDSYTQQQELAAAQAHGNDLASGNAFGGSGPVNTATIAGDYNTGETYGYPQGQGGPSWGTRLDNIPPGPAGNTPSLPMASAPGSSLSSASTSGFNQPLLGGTPVTGPQLPGAASGDMNADQRLVRDASGNVVGVRSANGYYDPNFQSTQHMLDNYQQGDRVPGTVDALRILAEMGNGNAKAVLGADAATGSNMAGSQLEADWAKRHNGEIQSRLAGGAFQGNGAAQNTLQTQQVQVNGTPNSDAQSFPMAQKMADDLAQIHGVGNVKLDGYGNVVFTDDAQKSATNPTGVAHIPMNEWADWYPVIADRLSKQNAPAATNPTGNGGGAPPRGNTAPRSNSAPPSKSPSPGTQNNDVTAPTATASNPPLDDLAAQRLAEFFPTADSRKNVPRSVASAVAYAPGIYPGGKSPYDQ